MQFPIHIGPYLKNSTISSDKTFLKYMQVEESEPIFVFDVILEGTNYEERLINLRQICNNNDRLKLTDLPMVKVNDMQEFILEQKKHFENGEKGIIYYTSYSNIRRPSVIVFKKE